MIDPVFYISLIYFLIGAIAIVFINRKRPEKSRELWTKYIAYFIIVNGLFLSFYSQLASTIIAAIICVSAIFEWTRIYPFKTKNPLVYLLTLATLGFFLYHFFHFMSDGNYFFKRETYLLVFCLDGFSQICGQLVGKTPLTKISPNKTVEGTAAGFVITGITLAAFSGFNVPAICILMVVAFFGDLMASAYKRYCGVKDFSNLIPGHGGVMDRFDSFIPTGALIWLMFGL